MSNHADDDVKTDATYVQEKHHSTEEDPRDPQILRYIVGTLNVVLFLYMFVFFLVDVIVVIYYGASNWINLAPTLTGHFAISLIHAVLCIPFMITCIIGFFTFKKTLSEKSIFMLLVVYI